MRPFVSGLDPRRCGERGLAAPPTTGHGFSAIRRALDTEARLLRLADVAARNGCPVTARRFRADAAAAVSAYRHDRVSTFDGEPVAIHPGQERLF